ncbi:Fe-S oxidoreductase [Candidatus Magnetobacterium bavaricum]|uniref:Fe-S oxidoreductase n=1 Tax=Candidatus Magnetobacterium bavaricum TaxID=29290 RepID=A0A0F3GHC7_9BACT|nr:Fe-S oxidoreductase [Candidatus Magnetobacterium bavaricum]
MNKNILFVWTNRYGFGYKPISISILSALAKHAGFNTSLWETSGIMLDFDTGEKTQIDINLFKDVDLKSVGIEKKRTDVMQSFKEHFLKFNPKYLAVSVINDERFLSGRISELAKTLNQDIITIWGGKYPTIAPENVLKAYKVDYVCVGEGFDAFPELLNTIESNGDVSKISNIGGWYNKMLFTNSVRPLKKNLDDLPYLDWDIFDPRHMYKPFDGNIVRGGDYMSNFGCPYHCTYCINHFNHDLYNNKYYIRRFSVERAVEELAYLKEKYDLNFIKFHDEDFLMRPEENFAKWSKAYKEKINLRFTIETNAISFTKTKVDLLKQMNCASVSVAIETGNQNLRRNVLRRVDSESDIINAFTLLKEVGIRATSFNLIGFPFETRETYNETVDINRKADVQYPNISFFFPYEGTVLRDISIKEGKFVPDLLNDENETYKNDRPTLKFEHLTEEELIGMRRVFVLRVKLPEVYHPFVLRSEKNDEIGNLLFQQLKDIFNKTVFEKDGFYDDGGYQNIYLDQLLDIYTI